MPPTASFHDARALLVDAVPRHVTPCAVAEVGSAAGPIWSEAVGALTYEASAPRATHSTIFDLASVTKVLATTTAALKLVEAGRLALDAPVRDLVPGWRSPDRASVTVHDLLAHASGLPAYLPLYERCARRADFEEAICAAPLEYAPRSASIYSDLGFMLLGFVLEDLAGPLDAQFATIAAPLLRDTEDVLQYGPLGKDAAASADERLARVAPTQVDEWRGGRLLRGEVDDRNAAALGGIAGHSGTFGTVATVGRFARHVLRARLGDAHNAVASPSAVARFTARTSVPGSSRGLGWDTMLPTSSCGTLMSEDAFGHTGFTGTTVWIDPGVNVYVVLLTNRVHPAAGSGEPIRALRRAFHDAVMREIRRVGELGERPAEES